jgi:hypothetical protein
MKKEREEWAPAFAKLGMTTEQVMKLSGTEFVNFRDFLDSEGIKPGPQPPVDEAAMERVILEAIKRKGQLRNKRAVIHQPQIRPARVRPGPRARVDPAVAAVVAEHYALMEEQDKEYDEVLMEEQKRKQQKEAEEEAERWSIEDLKTEILRKAENLGAEPDDGLTLAVVLPNQRRILRKFDRSRPGSDVFDWVAAQEEMIGGEMEMPRNFDLRSVTGVPIVKESSLEDQGIAGRTIINDFVHK